MATETRPRVTVAEVKKALEKFVKTLNPSSAPSPSKPLFDAKEVGKRVEKQAEEAEKVERSRRP